MNKLFYLFLIPCVGYFSALSGQNALEQILFELPDISFEVIETPANYQAAYELKVKQPLDHEDPSKGYFYQRVYLSHQGFNAPTVLVTEGYEREKNVIYELTNMIGANQVIVEHRFFGESVPEASVFDWHYLNLKQATADLHHIRQLLGQIYSDDWVSTGISKGGQTTIFYRYFYPQDVEVSVPYVAPLNLQYADPRIYAFLDTIGSDACRKAIRDVQMRLLKDRDKILPLLKWYYKGAEASFTYMSLETAFEYAVLEYPFSFWQLGYDCEKIPDTKKASLEEMTDYLLSVVGLDFYADQGIKQYAPHYWQASSEMGYYGYETEDFKDLLKALPAEPHASFAPEGAKELFNDRLIKAVFDWTQTKGNEMIYIYGAIDTWTATGVPPSNRVNALWYIMDGRDHRNARIKNLSAQEQDQLFDQMNKWLKD
ncbi:MAG TPA: S28 family serine protease [Saprospiraceae bacterium]|nr:S28 family serine protease [Saprospiraceae bacterium]HMQ82125.1 S28 family serine protease [Saprospiraceae bacterium]